MFWFGGRLVLMVMWLLVVRLGICVIGKVMFVCVIDMCRFGLVRLNGCCCVIVGDVSVVSSRRCVIFMG